MNKLKYLFIITIILFIILLLFDHTHFTGITQENDKNILDYIINRLYFCLQFISTTGSGDIVSKSNILKFVIIIFHIIMLILLFL